MTEVFSIVYNYPDGPLEKLVLCFISFFFCILFMQSGFDKVFNWKENLSFLTNHFNKTIMRNYIFILLMVLTFLECLTGLIFCIILIAVCFFGFSTQIMSLLLLGMTLSNFTICCLFLGQRIANDYEGASNLTIYFLVALLGLLFVV